MSDLQIGIELGWWEKIENGEPVPFPIRMKISDFHDKATIANVAVAVGVHKTTSEARRAGYTAPLTKGEYRFKNGKFGYKRVIIE